MQDAEGALREFRAGSKLAPSDAELRLEVARANFQMNQFDEAEKELKEAANSPCLVGLTKRKYWDTRLQLYQRKAEFVLRSHETRVCTDALKTFMAVYNQCPAFIRDRHVAYTLNRAASTARYCLTIVAAITERKDITDVLNQLETARQGLFFNEPIVTSKQRCRGIVNRLDRSGNAYGFISRENGSDVFFHFSAIENLKFNEVPTLGSNITFDIGMNANGPCAVNCRLEDLKSPPASPT
jgi:CspA family cold shock protein